MEQPVPHFAEVVPGFAVAGQITTADVARAAAAGFRSIVNNRPDGEEAGQASGAEIEAAAQAHGLAYAANPIGAQLTPFAIDREADLLEQLEGPVLAYCRSGRRSTLLWAAAQAQTGARSRAEIIAAAAGAGHDLMPLAPLLEQLAQRR